MDAAGLGRLRAGPCHFSGGVTMATDFGRLTIGQRGEIMRGSATVAQMILTSGNHKQALADRALFVGSPDLLDALIALAPILATAESNASGNPEWEAVSAKINAARAAIAKATGK